MKHHPVLVSAFWIGVVLLLLTAVSIVLPVRHDVLHGTGIAHAGETEQRDGYAFKNGLILFARTRVAVPAGAAADQVADLSNRSWVVIGDEGAWKFAGSSFQRLSRPGGGGYAASERGAVSEAGQGPLPLSYSNGITGGFSSGTSLAAIRETSFCLSLRAFGIIFVLPATFVFLRDHLRQRQARRVGCCVQCGYDIRASPKRCPECGAAVPERREADTA